MTSTDYLAEAAAQLGGRRAGWWPLLAGLLADAAAVDPAAAEMLRGGTKFGYLHVDVYPRGAVVDERIGELIRAAERASSSVCETCGQPGETRWCFTWVTTLCPSCALTHPGGRRPAIGPGGSAYPPHATLPAGAACGVCGYVRPAK